METTAFMVTGVLRNMRIASVLNVAVEHNGNLEQGINDYQRQKTSSQQGESQKILLALEALYQDSLENRA